MATCPISTTIKRECENQPVVLYRRGHPFDGQEITIFRRRRREGTGKLIVEAEFPDGRRQWIPARWTNLESRIYSEVSLHGYLSDFVALAELVDALRRRQDGGTKSGTDTVEPSGMAGSSVPMGGNIGGSTTSVCDGTVAVDGSPGCSGAR